LTAASISAAASRIFLWNTANAQALLARAGHDVAIFDAQAEGMDEQRLAAEVNDFRAEMTVMTTAPSYLFWRCAPPELRVPQQALAALGRGSGITVAIGPHGSTTPRATLRKLQVDAVVLGECEEALVRLADTPRQEWRRLAGLCHADGGEIVVQGGPQTADVPNLPALAWPIETLRRHAHHHHRFDVAPVGSGAEMEASRGCPYHCSFCAKENFRDNYRRRPLSTLLSELDGLIAAGVVYVYFIDEIFLPWWQLLEALAERPISFGVQTRIDLWNHAMLDLLGAAGCVSIEAGVESLTQTGRDWLDKQCKLSTEALTERLIYAKRSTPFVQANLIASGDDKKVVQRWREQLRDEGVWANDPVPLFPYPGSPDYTRLWGLPDDDAWERAVDYYLDRYSTLSDLQEARPSRLDVLEAAR
jgi:anaerobic magnesium-protoporphyrin IX monomethyl ester cyclase